MGQSNMVGMGDLSGGSVGWGPALLKLALSVYEGAYSASADYDTMTPVSTTELPGIGVLKPTPATGGRTCVVRGQIQMKTAAVCELSPGHAGSSYNIMVIDGTEVYRREVGKEPVRKPFRFEEGKTYPFRVVYLTSELNGAGWYRRMDVPGTLETLVKDQKKYPFLVDDRGEWAVRRDVYYYDARTKHGGFLSATANNGRSIGPELGFGFVMGQLFEEPVLILKSCIGNRSLGWDLLPPGSERYQAEVTERSGQKVTKVFAGYRDRPDSWVMDRNQGLATKPPPWVDKKTGKPVDWYAGKQYDDDMANAKAALANLAKIHPDYQGQGLEIAGFVWWQGHKDHMNAVHAGRYEQNLARLIPSLRKDYNAPNAKFVLATGCGNPGRTGLGLQVAEAQLAIADARKHPEFAGNVSAVDSRDLWREADVSPKNQGYHYNRNAETFLEVGLRLGGAMAELLGKF
ncbi:MAG: hypothetical protein JXQ71_09755 [Verrucomicrobia bacterium]|nr:hypothetical protein [Verrucomicrobiota bacterium]